MSGTLAYNMRPQSLLDILGQKHIIGENGLFTKFVEKNHPMSVILYGPPGCGKTTLAMALAHDLNMPCRTFNASTGNKKEMDLIIEEAKLSNGLFVIIDEIHRMNKMKQDNLLPYVESGLLIIVGCTTANPYHSINPAIRSRCQIIEVKPLTQEDIIQGLHHALDSEKGYHHQYQCDEEVLQHIARLSSGDIRFAYNCLEVCTIISHDNHITIEDAKNALTQANGQFDKDEDQYYDTLSGLQKSIRGSDPNGAMYYFAKLIEYNDIESLNMYKDRLSKGYSHNEIMESIYAKGRDNARTPMQWDDSENAGFTTGTPWLAVNKNYDKINAKQCLQDENSIFNHYKKLIDIRKNNDTIIYGDYKLLCEDDENIFAYVRELNGDKILVVCNFYDKDVEFKFEGDFNYSKVLLSNYNDSSKMIEKLKLRPYEAVMYRFN